MKMSYYTKLAGVSFRQEAVSKLKPGKTPLRCVAQTDNQFDEYAVAVDALLEQGWTQIGFIAKGKNQHLHKYLLDGGQVTITCKDVTGEDKKTLGVNVAIEYGEDDSVNLDDLDRQRVLYGDEPFVYFDPTLHKAYDSRGRQLTSGSMAENKYHPDADLSFAAKALSKKTGQKVEDVMATWEAKGELAQLFGTALHRAIELRLLYLDTMNALDDAKQRDQSAVNWMPSMFGDAVEKLEAVLFDKLELNQDYLKTEARIKYGNLTGIVDLLHMDNDGNFYLFDFKTNREINKVKYTEFGEQTKYTVQQNLYRTILEKLGYKCLGMYLLHWTGEKWRRIKLQKINLDEEIEWEK